MCNRAARPTDSVKAMRGEVLASRALALATVGRLSEAIEMGSAAASADQGVETGSFGPPSRRGRSPTRDSTLMLRRGGASSHVAFDSGAVDRWCARIDGILTYCCTVSQHPRVLSETVFALTRAGDQELATSMGLEIAGSLRPALEPSRLASGRCTNSYARALRIVRSGSDMFISEATVKVHVHHMYDKLGIRSRTALAMNAIHERVRPRYVCGRRERERSELTCADRIKVRPLCSSVVL